MSEPDDEHTRRAYADASDEDKARSEKSVAEIVEEDKADPNTPDDFDVPLTPYQPPEDPRFDEPGHFGAAFTQDDM